ncbi:MAG: murein L,D-transpeptidase [Acidimicrobiia bacterium]|nr:murein L,D-transpeptidase [Acidimicrobiia bacterium]
MAHGRALLLRRCFGALSVLALVGFLGGFAPGPLAWGAETPGAAVHSVGLFDPATGEWYLRDDVGRTTRIARFGGAGVVPLMGDWDGDGIDTPAVYRSAAGRLFIRNGRSPVSFVHPILSDGIPVVADFDGDGRDTVSVAKGGLLFVNDQLGTTPNGSLTLDPFPLSVPKGTEALIGGDFDGDGADEAAAVRQGMAFLLTPGGPVPWQYLGVGLPVAGDWDGDGVDTLGGYDMWRAQFRLFGPPGRGEPTVIDYGAAGMAPVAGYFGTLPGADSPPRYGAGLPAMDLGEEGPHVLVLQQELARRHLYRGPLDGVFSDATSHAVMAFHKVMEAERTWVWEATDSLLMARFRLPPLPVRPDEPDRVEVDLGRQAAYVFRDGEVVEIIPVSSGGGYRYYSDFREMDVWAVTPRGDFTLYRHVVGWDWVMRTEEDTGRCRPYSGDYCVYSPWNFAPWAALHGYEPVPEYPVSHGCIRMTLWDADALEGVLFVGMPFHVWDEYPAAG